MSMTIFTKKKHLQNKVIFKPNVVLATSAKLSVQEQMPNRFGAACLFFPLRPVCLSCARKQPEDNFIMLIGWQQDLCCVSI